MNLHIDYDPVSGKGVIAATEPSVSAWNRVQEEVRRSDPEALVGGAVLEAGWHAVAAAIPTLSRVRRAYGCTITLSPSAEAYLQTLARERQAVAGPPSPTDVHPDTVQSRLAALGFRRILTPEQRRDLAVVAGLPHGANFSVPGSGKTTVALAVHALVESGGADCLFVVAPKNALMAWTDALKECFGNEALQFERLGIESSRAAATLLRVSPPPRRLLITYEELTKHVELLAQAMQRGRVHLILDESHRIKAGRGSLRGRAAMRLAPSAVRRDVLSGTPVPNALSDLDAQLEFLWHGQAATVRARASERRIFVRTTKRELRLPTLNRHYLAVPMSTPQLALYALARDELISRAAGLRKDDLRRLRSARRAVMRLLQISSNPIAAVERMKGDSSVMESLRLALRGVGLSPKIQVACDMARELARSGEKVVVWSSFRSTVAVIAAELGDLGAQIIQGDTRTGGESEAGTRENIVARFNDSGDDCRVLVANPAAGGEGISLHKACRRAVYVDRTFNAAHYLQSIDRIHRLGMDVAVPVEVTILEHSAPDGVGSVDQAVRRRISTKLRDMFAALDDPDLRLLQMDEDGAGSPIDRSMDYDDIVAVVKELLGAPLQ